MKNLMPSWKVFKGYTIPSKCGVLGFWLTFIGLILTVVSIGVTGFNQQDLNNSLVKKVDELNPDINFIAIEKQLEQYASSSKWDQYDQVLDSISKLSKYKDAYLYYKGCKLILGSRQFSDIGTANFYFNQITKSSSYFDKSVYMRIVNINKQDNDNEFVSEMMELKEQLETFGYKGPYYHLSEYLLLLKTKFNNVDQSYSDFIKIYPFINDGKFVIDPMTVYRDEGAIDLNVLSQLVGLNYLFLINTVKHSEDEKKRALARNELIRLYKSNNSVKITQIGLNELGLGNGIGYLGDKIKVDLKEYVNLNIEDFHKRPLS